MTDVIELVARSIYSTRVSAQQNTMPWDELMVEWKDHWRDCARAAIAALADALFDKARAPIVNTAEFVSVSTRADILSASQIVRSLLQNE